MVADRRIHVGFEEECPMLSNGKFSHGDSSSNVNMFVSLLYGNSSRGKCGVTSSVNVDNTEKRFVCSFCSKTFRKRYNWKVHTWIHTGEKPYKCRTCRKPFRLSHHLQKHCSTMHKFTST